MLLRAVVNHNVDFWNWTWVLWKSNQCLNHGAISPASLLPWWTDFYKVRSWMLILSKQSFTDLVTDTGHTSGQFMIWTVKAVLTSGPSLMVDMLVAPKSRFSHVTSQMWHWVYQESSWMPDTSLGCPFWCWVHCLECVFFAHSRFDQVFTLLNAMCGSEVS